MYQISEAAALSGLTVRALRHYDAIGLLQPATRSDAGYRLYGNDDIEACVKSGTGQARPTVCRNDPFGPCCPGQSRRVTNATVLPSGSSKNAIHSVSPAGPNVPSSSLWTACGPWTKRTPLASSSATRASMSSVQR